MYLEDAGATILRKDPTTVTGENLFQAGQDLQKVSCLVPQLRTGDPDADLSGQRLAFAAQKLSEAGDQLRGTTETETNKNNKSWLKQGFGGGGGL